MEFAHIWEDILPPRPVTSSECGVAEITYEETCFCPVAGAAVGRTPEETEEHGFMVKRRKESGND